MANQMKIQLCQGSTSTSEATLRGHQVLIDRPAEKGGADMGPMGGELFLAAVGGCFMSNLLAAIRAREMGITGVCTEVIGTLADSPSRFSAVYLYVTADSVSREMLERLRAIADRAGIMISTLHGKVDLHRRNIDPACTLTCNITPL